MNFVALNSGFMCRSCTCMFGALSGTYVTSLRLSNSSYEDLVTAIPQQRQVYSRILDLEITNVTHVPNHLHIEIDVSVDPQTRKYVNYRCFLG
jgi:hypothetical protein